MVSNVPVTPWAGPKLVRVGAKLAAVTVKGTVLVVVPPGATTVMLPEVAPTGTVTIK